MPGLVPGIHVFRGSTKRKTYMAGTSPAVTETAGYVVAFATKARQPPNAEMSFALPTSAASTIKPLMPRPSFRRTVPIDSGGGIAATNLAKAAAGSAQSSSSIDVPAPVSTRSIPGFGGVVDNA